MGVEKNRIMSQGYELLGELSAYKSVHKESFHCKKLLKYNSISLLESSVQENKKQVYLESKGCNSTDP